jgi:hypothetical protein
MLFKILKISILFAESQDLNSNDKTEIMEENNIDLNSDNIDLDFDEFNFNKNHEKSFSTLKMKDYIFNKKNDKLLKVSLGGVVTLSLGGLCIFSNILKSPAEKNENKMIENNLTTDMEKGSLATDINLDKGLEKNKKAPEPLDLKSQNQEPLDDNKETILKSQRNMDPIFATTNEDFLNKMNTLKNAEVLKKNSKNQLIRFKYDINYSIDNEYFNINLEKNYNLIKIPLKNLLVYDINKLDIFINTLNKFIFRFNLDMQTIQPIIFGEKSNLKFYSKNMFLTTDLQLEHIINDDISLDNNFQMLKFFYNNYNEIYKNTKNYVKKKYIAKFFQLKIHKNNPSSLIVVDNTQSGKREIISINYSMLE